ncbi:MAG: repeat-associated core protein [Pseudomonas sp.]|nr:repeat-associated core protein [Pseudomonas sp.]
MQTPNKFLLCKYQYNALDQLTASTLFAKPGHQRFYRKDHLVTEIAGDVELTIVQHQDQPLAQHVRDKGQVQSTLLATNLSHSVLLSLGVGGQPNSFAYTLYGYLPVAGGLLSLLGFNGQRPDQLTGYYLLGNGYRAFNPVLMRFNSPDSLSPFGEGGVNAYAYCKGDPVNQEDSTGHMPFFSKKPKASPPKNFKPEAAKSTPPPKVPTVGSASSGDNKPGSSSGASNANVLPMSPTQPSAASPANALQALPPAPSHFSAHLPVVDDRARILRVVPVDYAIYTRLGRMNDMGLIPRSDLFSASKIIRKKLGLEKLPYGEFYRLPQGRFEERWK